MKKLSKVSEAAKLLGMLGGRSTSAAKQKAVRLNGQKGGRPRLKKNLKRVIDKATA